jgi:hypothetical protein
MARPPGGAGVCAGGALCAPNHAVPASAIATIHGPVFVMVHLSIQKDMPVRGAACTRDETTRPRLSIDIHETTFS